MPASTQINYKKVILIISEGATEKISLENILKNLYNTNKIKFQYVYGDITTRNGVNVNNIESKIKEIISTYIKRDKGFLKSDILRIIHLVDTDGCFIPDSNIIEDLSCEKYTYSDENITAKNKGVCKKRNKNKSAIINKMLTLKKIFNIDYGVYYLSSNLDHVLHNQQNMPKKYKQEYASQFKEKYLGRENEFLADLAKENLLYKGTYDESWIYIKKGTNSLKRKTNLNIAIKDD